MNVLLYIVDRDVSVSRAGLDTREGGPGVRLIGSRFQTDNRLGECS